MKSLFSSLQLLSVRGIPRKRDLGREVSFGNLWVTRRVKPSEWPDVSSRLWRLSTTPQLTTGDRTRVPGSAGSAGTRHSRRAAPGRDAGRQN